MQPFGGIPAHGVGWWGEDDHGATWAHHSPHFCKCLLGFDNMLDHVGAENHVDRGRTQGKISVEIQDDRRRAGELCGGQQRRVVVRRNRKIMVTPGPGKDRARAATEVDNRRSGFKSGQLAPNNVDLAAVDPAKKILIFRTAVIV